MVISCIMNSLCSLVTTQTQCIYLAKSLINQFALGTTVLTLCKSVNKKFIFTQKQLKADEQDFQNTGETK